MGWAFLIYMALNSFLYNINYIFEVVFYDSSIDDLLQLVNVVIAKEPLSGSKTWNIWFESWYKNEINCGSPIIL